MFSSHAGIREANAVFLWLTSTLLVFSVLVAACGKAEIDISKINAGNSVNKYAALVNKHAATMHEGGAPVTGTVVTRNGNGQLVDETQYKDGFPNGRLREWYDNGQPKLEQDVKYVDRGQYGGALETVGEHKTWCENGTLSADLPHDADGKPKGEHQTWSCDGKLLSQATMPDGEFRKWAEVKNGNPVLVEEGARVESGQLDGEHRMYDANGTVVLVENWSNATQNGDYKRLNANGSIAEAGRYENGKKTGTWIVSYGNNVNQYWDYDPADFNKQEYVAAFMQAAGIEATGQSGPPILRDYQVDADKIRYYVKQGLVDPKKKLNLDINTRYNEFKSHIWTYPYVQASRDALPVLIELGADPKAIDSNNRTRLHYCVESLYQGTCTAADIKQLLALGIDANQGDATGKTALHLLMNYYQVPDETSRYGQKRLAKLADLMPMIQMLLDAGADTDAQTYEGLTPAMLALQAKMYDVAGALLEHSKNPRQTDKQGFNLIHHAFLVPGMNNQFSLELTDDIRTFVELAASKGVDPRAPIGDGQSLVDLAEQNGAIDLAQYLKQLNIQGGKS